VQEGWSQGKDNGATGAELAGVFEEVGPRGGKKHVIISGSICGSARSVNGDGESWGEVAYGEGCDDDGYGECGGG
jgi:hypothetical protein